MGNDRDFELHENGNKNGDVVNATGYLTIPNRDGIIRANYSILSPDVNITFSTWMPVYLELSAFFYFWFHPIAAYPFNNGTEVTYYAPLGFMPNEK